MRTMARVGVRVVSMAHFGRTFLADGSGLDATSRSRLTPQGIEALREMEQLGVVFDISHLGLAGVEDVLDLATRPFLATHSACLGITDIHRNLGDEQLKRRSPRSAGSSASRQPSRSSSTPPARQPTASSTTSSTSSRWPASTTSASGRTSSTTTTSRSSADGSAAGRCADRRQFAPAEISRPSDLPKITEAMVRRGLRGDRHPQGARRERAARAP